MEQVLESSEEDEGMDDYKTSEYDGDEEEETPLTHGSNVTLTHLVTTNVSAGTKKGQGRPTGSLNKTKTASRTKNTNKTKTKTG